MCAWAFVVCLFVCVLFLFLSVVYLFFSTLYLHADQHFISSVNSVEGINHCAFAQWGVLPHGDIPSSHRSWAQPVLCPGTSTSMMSNTPSIKPNAHPQNEEYCPVASLTTSSTTSTTQRLLQWSSRMNMWDAELDDEIIGKALSSPLFIHVREEAMVRRQAFHSYEKSLLPAQSFITHKRTDRSVHELS